MTATATAGLSDSETYDVYACNLYRSEASETAQPMVDMLNHRVSCLAPGSARPSRVALPLCAPFATPFSA